MAGNQGFFAMVLNGCPRLLIVISSSSAEAVHLSKKEFNFRFSTGFCSRLKGHRMQHSKNLRAWQQLYLNNPMFWKRKKADETQDNKIILGMVMLQDDNTFNVDGFSDDFKSHYGDNIQGSTGDNSSLVCTVNGEMVAIAHLPVPIPPGDIEGTAKYAYNWETALEETKEHKSHLIVSLMQGRQDQVERYKTFTQVLCSLLRTTTSIGVYKGSQSLLIPKEDYLNEADLMSDEYLPLNLWIYFGLLVTDNGNSGYTYGLKAFNKTEMEILNSSKSLEEIRGFLFNMAHYVLDYNVDFKDGQTCGLSEEEKIPITFSKGKLLEGKTFKLGY
jgi:hypothetical protein